MLEGSIGLDVVMIHGDEDIGFELSSHLLKITAFCPLLFRTDWLITTVVAETYQ